MHAVVHVTAECRNPAVSPKHLADAPGCSMRFQLDKAMREA